MAQQFPSTSSCDQEMRYPFPQSQTFPASVLSSMIPRRHERVLPSKTDEEAMYELMSLGTQYSASIVSFSDRLQSKARTKDKLIEENEVLQRLLFESNRKIKELKQQNKDLKSLLTSTIRLPNLLDKDDMIFF